MKKRIFLIANIGFIIGIIGGLYLYKNVIPLFLSIFVVTVFVIIIKRTSLRKIKLYKGNTKKYKISVLYKVAKYLKVCIGLKSILIFIIFITLGVSFTMLKTNKFESFLNDMKKYNEETQKVYAIIVSDKEGREYNDMYKAKIIQVGNIKYSNTYAIIKIKKQKNKELVYGDLVCIEAEFYEPADRTNFKGFSYKNYLRTINIYGIFKCNYSNVRILENDKFSAIMTIANVTRNYIEQKMDMLYNGQNEEEKALLKGILLGIKDELTEEQKDNFKVSSLSHILAVSGMHITYVIAGIIFLFTAIGLRKQIVHILTIIIIIFFMFLTEFTPSVVRAGIMAILVLSAFLVKRKSDVWNNISIASLIILVNNPFALLSLSYELSFLGTIGIILGNKVVCKYKNNKLRINDKEKINELEDVNLKHNKSKKEKIDLVKKFFISTILVCISAQVFVTPIILINFNTISVYFLISNILIAPIIGIVIILGFMIVIISFFLYPLVECLNIVEIWLLKFINIMTNCVTNLPSSCIYCKTPYVISIVIHFFVILFLIYCYVQKNKTIKRKIYKNRRKIQKLLSLLLSVYLIILLVIDFNFFGIGNLKIYFIDVGQGDSTLIVTEKAKKILIDGGGNDNYDIGKNTTLPYLLDRRITTLDYMIISHFDSDHIQGLYAVLENITVKNVIIGQQIKSSSNYEKFLKIVQNKNVKVIVVNAGDKINIEKEVYIHILWPVAGEYITDNPLNNNSIVFKIVYRNFKILFTGDIEEKAENKILSKKIDVKADILKVAHHRFKIFNNN